MGTDSDTPFVSDTSIRVSEELADELYQRKGRSTSYEDYIWQLLERVDALEESNAARDPPRDDPPASTPADPPAATEGESGVTEGHREHLREKLSGSGETLEARVDAILAMYGHLRKEGEAEKGDFLALVDPETVRLADDDSVWSNMVKGKDTLSALPGVEKPPTGRSTWRYTDE